VVHIPCERVGSHPLPKAPERGWFTSLVNEKEDL
jgi:hypothetical protein